MRHGWLLEPTNLGLGFVLFHHLMPFRARVLPNSAHQSVELSIYHLENQKQVPREGARRSFSRRLKPSLPFRRFTPNRHSGSQALQGDPLISCPQVGMMAQLAEMHTRLGVYVCVRACLYNLAISDAKLHKTRNRLNRKNRAKSQKDELPIPRN